MRTALGSGVIGIALALSGCGATSHTSPDASTTGTNAEQSAPTSSVHPTRTTHPNSVLRVTYRQVTPDNDLAAAWDYDAVVQNGRVRLEVVAYGDESGSRGYPFMTVTFDGSRELIRQGNNYELFPNAAHAKWPGGGGPALNIIAAFLPFDPHTDYSQSLCPNARQARKGSSVGRPAREYSCTQPAGRRPHAIWIDDAFGIALSPLVPADAEFVADPRIDTTTFSTRPPAGAKVEVFDAPLKPGDKAPDFTVTEVPACGCKDKPAVGKPISSRKFAGRPYVLAFFEDTILFGPEGKQAAALRQLDELTSGGTGPAVLGVLITPDGFVDKGGLFASKGWHFPVAYTGSRLPHKFGFGEQLGFVFVTADGILSAVHAGLMTKAELQAALTGTA